MFCEAGTKQSFQRPTGWQMLRQKVRSTPGMGKLKEGAPGVGCGGAPAGAWRRLAAGGSAPCVSGRVEIG